MYILASIIDKRSMTIYGSLWGTTHAGIQMNNRIALSISSFDVATFIYAISLGTNWINIRCMTAYGDFYINSNFSGLMSIGPGDLAGYSFSAATFNTLEMLWICIVILLVSDNGSLMVHMGVVLLFVDYRFYIAITN